METLLKTLRYTQSHKFQCDFDPYLVTHKVVEEGCKFTCTRQCRRQFVGYYVESLYL